jgi:hypothetical protein
VIEVRDNPRGAFAGHTNETPWDRLHAAYFDGYALWTYLTQPLLYTHPGFAVEEVEPWEEEDVIWRRLRVIFPDTIASHTREQVSYFGRDGLLRRHDYAVDVLRGATGAHYIDDYRDHGGDPDAASSPGRLPARRRQPENPRTGADHDRYRPPQLGST